MKKNMNMRHTITISSKKFPFLCFMLFCLKKKNNKKTQITYIFWPIVEFSWKSKSTSTSKLHVVIHQVIPPTTCKKQGKVLIFSF
jgi:hypothetical protein